MSVAHAERVPSTVDEVLHHRSYLLVQISAQHLYGIGDGRNGRYVADVRTLDVMEIATKRESRPRMDGAQW